MQREKDSKQRMKSNAILKLGEVTKHFGGLIAVDRVSFEIEKNEIKALIGPNGAGKTTLLNMISLFYKPDYGTIEFMGHTINSFSPYKIPAFGLARTFQQVQISGHMSVIESIMVGMHCLTKEEMMGAVFQTPNKRREERQIREKAELVMEFLNIQHLRNFPTDSLSWGDRRRVELGKALAGNPKLLMLDEPVAGLNQFEIDQFIGLLGKIRTLEISILLVEHNVPLVMSVADKVVVLNFGQKIAEGTPQEVATNPEVVKAYLGEEG